MTKPYFSELLPVLADRAKSGAISRLGFANVPLRRHLGELFDRPFGEAGAFLADPTFEAVFGWQKGKSEMVDLAGSLLTPDLVNAMDNPPVELRRDYRFARDQHPYTHQLEAWKLLSDPTPQSLVIASGTGSGKTECFMVPILDRLVRQKQEQVGKLIGVRALFLYPLNALINSQRERLRAWTHEFGEDIRFCLFNGNTPERPDRARLQREHLSEVLDRQSLRATPPPILVTNATMLEYMLVRTADAPILDKSQGKLEWVVLDEAHTYVGSQAAEAALLIRRVLLAFGVTPEQVRFIATSATIGDPEGVAGQKLKRFLADVAGVASDRVHLVAGQREVPELPNDAQTQTLTLSELNAISPSELISPSRFQSLVNDTNARRIRSLFVGDKDRPPVAKLSEVCRSLFNSEYRNGREQQIEALGWLDLLSSTRENDGSGQDDGQAFLPLRSHLFHQTLSGLWACSDPQCNKRAGTALDVPDWPFGLVYFEPRKHCVCGCPVYEIVSCSGCGSVHLRGGVEDDGRVTHLRSINANEEFELESETDEDDGDDEQTEEQTSSGKQSEILIVNRPFTGVEAIYIDKLTRKISESTENTLQLRAVEDHDGLVCPVCEGHDTSRNKLFRASRLGAPFLIGGILPTLLEYAPDSETPANHPCRGRRILSFNDSRQGTARMAANLQQDAERKRVRGLVYHIALQAGRTGVGSESVALRSELEALEQILAATPSPALESLIAAKRSRLDSLSDLVPLAFSELAGQLANQGQDFERMLKHYQRNAPGTFGAGSGPIELAKTFIVREFGRRPKRQNNLESMGMVSVQYPALKNALSVPADVRDAANFTLSEWHDFLKITVDFFVRGGGSLQISPEWRKWLGVSIPQNLLIGRDETNLGRNQRRWPRAKRAGMQSMLVRLLSCVLQADLTSTEGEDRIDVVLESVWHELIRLGLLQQTADGRVLQVESLAFKPMSTGWICPVTRRFLDTTLRGVTPYLPKKSIKENSACEQVDIPLYDEPFGGLSVDLDRIERGREWLQLQSGLTNLREQGLWSDLNDRVIELAPYFTTAEHSAQQDSDTLKRYEKDFKEGDLNLLSCSTTMEMGIDIGGIGVVSMNNVPPSPANYLQRAGRAGRRSETRSIAMTVCKSNPHDQAVFENSRWAFDSTLPAPGVSLDSPIIVQRHVHSLLLSRFLARHLTGSSQEQIRLTCGLFFLEDDSLADRFATWCRDFSPEDSIELAVALKQLIRRSVLEGQGLNRITEVAADAMNDVATRWLGEWLNLEREESEIVTAGGEKSAAFNAVSFHKKRLSQEYLLRELATRGFLPAYGFPTNIASFDNLTVGRFIRDCSEREDNRYRRRELASRDLITALREYAPGSEVVMDGLVYVSAGVTLNWHIPADQPEPHEIQDIRFVWRCRRCGGSDSSHSRGASQSCSHCGSKIEYSDIREFLQPAGFAVDFYQDPGNDVSTQHFVPVEAPWINAEGDWFPLSNPQLGRFRTTTRGHVFYQSRGVHGTGYALCLECGRAEPMLPGGDRPHMFTAPHRKLRRSKEDGNFCRGSNDSWKVKEGIALGHENWTDIFELQLRNESGAWINDATTALTAGVAIRDALAESIGVQATELGCEVKQARLEFGDLCYSILIFDRFAAGYSSSAQNHLGELFRMARTRLDCPANCDSACPRCILDFDQRFAADSLNRQAALAIFSDAWLNLLQLPEELAYFGPASRAESRRLSESIWQAIGKQTVTGVRFYTGGASEQWDIGLSALRELVYRLSGQGIDVEIIVPESILGSLDEADGYLLASLSDNPRITVFSMESATQCEAGWLLAETLGESRVRWAMKEESSLAFGPSWAQSSAPLIIAHGGSVPSGLGLVVESKSIRPTPTVVGDCEVEIHRELDGPVQGFGQRFWDRLRGLHRAAEAILNDADDGIIAVSYSDRYLLTPLSVALFLEALRGLMYTIGEGRWNVPLIQIHTTTGNNSNSGWTKNLIWSNWPDSTVRDGVLTSLISHEFNIGTSIKLADNLSMGHGRVLDLTFRSGKTLTLRLDQGFGYWRGVRNSGGNSNFFDFGITDESFQCSRLLNLAASVEGTPSPTQLFIKVR